MAYQPYVDKDFYDTYSGKITDAVMLDKKLKQASRHVDSLTYNRIVGKFGLLTEFQQEIVQEVVCELTDFEFINESQLSSLLSSYSINGVSMSIGDSVTVKGVNGVIIPIALYSLLEQSGLTYRGHYRVA
jgi:hypothetical protein